MGQEEIFSFLKNQRLSGNNKFFSAKEVHNALKTVEGCPKVLYNTHRMLNQLEAYGFLELQMSGKVYEWKRLFRIKEDYL